MSGFKGGKIREDSFSECKISDATRAVLEKLEKQREEDIDWVAEQTTEFIFSCLVGEVSNITKLVAVKDILFAIFKKAKERLGKEE